MCVWVCCQRFEGLVVWTRESARRRWNRRNEPALEGNGSIGGSNGQTPQWPTTLCFSYIATVGTWRAEEALNDALHAQNWNKVHTGTARPPHSRAGSEHRFLLKAGVDAIVGRLRH